jgi:tetratricopeptide (TPR) repeat protein
MRGWESERKDHLAIYGAIDIALDSFPYNGATTTCEAMWMGVPVVSLAGDRHAGRMGSSLLNAMELGEFVARDVGEYVAICARLAGDSARLQDLRRHLRERLQRSPLMDEAGFTRRLERCYVEFWEGRPRADAAPQANGTGAGNEFLAQARLLREAGRVKEARAACEKILEEKPDHVEALTLLWDIALDDGVPGAAIDWLNKAIAADGGVASFHYMLGCVLQAQGKVGDAIVSLRQALLLDPAQAKTHNNLGCMLEAAGDLSGAADCYRGAIRFDPGWHRRSTIWAMSIVNLATQGRRSSISNRRLPSNPGTRTGAATSATCITHCFSWTTRLRIIGRPSKSIPTMAAATPTWAACC